jgi:NAD(P)H-hydrate epimerase
VTTHLSVGSNSVFTTEQLRELENIAIEKKKVPGIDLMERAGKATWKILKKTWPQSEKIIVVCGAGNNAGDGYVVARCALEHNNQIELVALTDPDKLRGDAHIAAQRFLSTGHSVLRSITDIELNEADVIVDAILGTGLDRGMEGDYLTAVNVINDSESPVLSIDIPSGLNANTGMPMEKAIYADLTITFIGQKLGLYIGYGAEYRGNMIFDDLSIPKDVYHSVKVSSSIVDVSCYSHFLPRRSRTGHKGNYGHALIVGGDYGVAGAVRLSGEAAARTGTGLVSIATRPEHALTIPSCRPELMALGVTSAADMHSLLKRVTVIAIGPGLGQSKWSQILFSRVLDTDLPMVVDADALNLLSQEPIQRDNWVLTPHPGEAARLLNCTVEDIQSNRLASATALQEKFGGVIVLKGPGTIITGKCGQTYICSEGNPGMACGGMGDVLTGIITGLIAQNLTIIDAAVYGVCLHARAADEISLLRGERGMLAMDLMPYIRQLVNSE